MQTNFDKKNVDAELKLNSMSSNDDDRRMSLASMPSEEPTNAVGLGTPSSIILSDYQSFLGFL